MSPSGARSSYRAAAPRAGTAAGGGSVWLVGDESLNTLHHLKFRHRWAADRGRHGEGSNRTGRSGVDLEVPVPLGTVARDTGDDSLVGEVLGDGERLLVARGGRGGRGNARFATSTNRAPRRFEEGTEGESRRLSLELKLLADVGVVGLPNAGKSTLISTISAARPKVADYPFTTVAPSLGVVARDAVSRPFVIADLPGLIAGAAAGAGLGFRFLRHVERCRILVHLVDLATGEGSAEEDLEVVEGELAAFNPALMRRPRIVVGSKADAADPERSSTLAAAATERELLYLEISSATHQGTAELVSEIERLLAEHPTEAHFELDAEEPPESVEEAGGSDPEEGAS